MAVLEYGYVLVFRADQLKLGVQPTWKEFFDPNIRGRRAMRDFPVGNIEIALLSLGRDLQKQLYVPNLTRSEVETQVEDALRQMASIRQQMVWWNTGDQLQQLLVSGDVLMAASWSGRVWSVHQQICGSESESHGPIFGSLARIIVRKATWHSRPFLAISGRNHREAVEPRIPNSVRSRTIVVIDECHTVGAYGATGFECFGGNRADLRILGFSKAFGTMGSVVCGWEDLVNTLRQVGSPWIFSTAVPPVLTRVNSALLPVVTALDQERKRIQALAERFRHLLGTLGVSTIGAHHITGLLLSREVGDILESRMRESGYYLKVSRYPIRPLDTPTVRICFAPEHTEEDVAGLVAALRGVLGP